MRTLPRALALASTLALGAAVGLPAAPAVAGPAATSPVLAAPAVAAQHSVVAKTATLAKKKAPAIGWEKIKRTTKKPFRLKETLRVPYLKNVSAARKKAFNQAVSKEFAQLRKHMARERGNGSGCVAPYLKTYKPAASIYKGRYAAAAIPVDAWIGCGAHSWGVALGATLDLKTGKPVKLSTFVTKKNKKAVTRALNRGLAKVNYGIAPSGFTTPAAWTVSSKGLTFYFNQGDVASSAEGIVSVKISAKTLKG